MSSILFIALDQLNQFLDAMVESVLIEQMENEDKQEEPTV